MLRKLSLLLSLLSYLHSALQQPNGDRIFCTRLIRRKMCLNQVCHKHFFSRSLCELLKQLINHKGGVSQIEN